MKKTDKQKVVEKKDIDYGKRFVIFIVLFLISWFGVIVSIEFLSMPLFYVGNVYIGLLGIAIGFIGLAFGAASIPFYSCAVLCVYMMWMNELGNFRGKKKDGN